MLIKDQIQSKLPDVDRILASRSMPSTWFWKESFFALRLVFVFYISEGPTCCVAQGSLELAITFCLSLLSTGIVAGGHQVHFEGELAEQHLQSESRRVHEGLVPRKLSGFTADGFMAHFSPCHFLKSRFLNCLPVVLPVMMYSQARIFL